mmetsp:Transcript_97521/g.314897  ORF Transcript_97521/g.314897 Transcript_97521/m.314897 type:complete len:217 (-) Transcript_97521:9-659(-)
MQASTTRGHASLRPCRTSGRNCADQSSAIAISAWSWANCSKQPHAVARTRGWSARSFAFTMVSTWVSVSSSSTYSMICRNRARPATTVFHSAFWNKATTAGCKMAIVCGKCSMRCMDLQIRSTTSAPKWCCGSSSSAPSFSSPAAQLSTSSSSSMTKATQISRIAPRPFGTFAIILGLPSVTEQSTSSASLRASSSPWDLATRHRTGRRCEAAQSL